MKQAASKGNTGNFSEADGYQLAADMLREIQEHWGAREDGVPDKEIATLWKRDDSAILRRYLENVERSRSAALARGFFAVLTDYLGSDSPTDAGFYEKAAHQHG